MSESEALRAVAPSLRARLTASARRLLGDAHEAEDVVQEALVRSARATPDGDPPGEGWLFQVCRRLSLDHLRARRRRERLVALASRTSLAAPEGPAGEAVRATEAERLRGAVAALDSPYREALTLRYLEERDIPAIAETLGAPERTIRTWIARGLERLRERLDP